MAKKIRSHKQVLEPWRRLAPVEDKRLFATLAWRIRVPVPTVHRWWDRESIPPKYWRRVLEATKARFGIEVTAEEMMIAAERRASVAAKADAEPVANAEQAA